MVLLVELRQSHFGLPPCLFKKGDRGEGMWEYTKLVHLHTSCPHSSVHCCFNCHAIGDEEKKKYIMEDNVWWLLVESIPGSSG